MSRNMLRECSYLIPVCRPGSCKRKYVFFKFLLTIGSCARQHLVDAYDMVWMSANTHMETLLARNLHQVFIRTNTGCFECLGRQLLVFVGDHVDAGREVIYGSSFSAEIEDSDLGIWDTAVEP